MRKKKKGEIEKILKCLRKIKLDRSEREVGESNLISKIFV